MKGTHDIQDLFNMTAFGVTGPSEWIDTSGAEKELVLTMSFSLDANCDAWVEAFGTNEDGLTIAAKISPTVVYGGTVSSGSLILPTTSGGGAVAIYRDLPKWLQLRLTANMGPEVSGFIKGSLFWR